MTKPEVHVLWMGPDEVDTRLTLWRCQGGVKGASARPFGLEPFDYNRLTTPCTSPRPLTLTLQSVNLCQRRGLVGESGGGGGNEGKDKEKLLNALSAEEARKGYASCRRRSSSSADSLPAMSAPSRRLSARSRLRWCNSTIFSSIVPVVTRR